MLVHTIAVDGRQSWGLELDGLQSISMLHVTTAVELVAGAPSASRERSRVAVAHRKFLRLFPPLSTVESKSEFLPRHVFFCSVNVSRVPP